MKSVQIAGKEIDRQQQMIRRELGFEPKHTIEDAIKDVCDAFKAGKIPNPIDDIRYYNIKTMRHLQMK